MNNVDVPLSVMQKRNNEPPFGGHYHIQGNRENKLVSGPLEVKPKTAIAKSHNVELVSEIGDTLGGRENSLSTISELLKYSQYYTGAEFIHLLKKLNYNQTIKLESIKHMTHASDLVFSKYLFSGIMTETLENILREFGYSEQDMSIEWYSRTILKNGVSETEQYRFIQYYCPNCKTYHIIPKFRTGKMNPYGLWEQTRTNSYSQMQKLHNMAEIRVPIIHLVLTYPEEISKTLETESEESVKKAWKTFELFYRKLEQFFCNDNQRIGCSVNTHIWSTQNPLGNPHLHHHILMPMIKVNSHVRIIRKFLIGEYRNINRIHKLTGIPIRHLEFKQREFQKLIKEIEWYNEKIEKLENRKLKEINLNDYEVVKRFNKILNEWKKERKKRISLINHIFSSLAIERIPSVLKRSKDGKMKRVPIDEKIIEKLWRETLIEQYPEINIPERININVSYAYNTDHYRNGHDISRMMLLHLIRYKSRKPLTDLSMYLNLNNKDITEKRKEWVKVLIKYRNPTKTFGFWNYIKQVEMFYSEKEPDGEFCFLCGMLMFKECAVKFNKLPKIDFILIKSGVELQVYKVPPPDLIKKQQTKKDFTHSPESSEEYIPTLRDKILKNFETGKRYTYDQLNQRLTDSEIEKSLFDGYIFRINTQTYGVV